MADIDNYGVVVDSDCVSQDFDEYDLYGEIMVGDDEEQIDDGILYE